ncbi:MAG: TolC family protein [Verrucomicrobia bacterium]|nr:TolC family protein [Verrucomicrobiota bacterium]
MTSQSDKNGNRRRSFRPLRAGLSAALLSLCAGALLAALVFGGCASAQHRQKADKEAYGIIQGKQKKLFGRTNEFRIETRYSARDPKSIPSVEIVQERIMADRRRITLPDALQIAITNSRTYQFNKEKLYLEALALRKEQNKFEPIFSGSSKGAAERQSDGDRTRSLNSQFGFSQLLKTGAKISATLFNDILRYYTGGAGSSTATSEMSVTLLQPLLRGAGAEVVAENLTQADRDVIYEVRTFTHFQNSFAVDIVGNYYRILQQKDAVKNAYTNYSNLVLSRQRAEALSFDRLPAFQADQARQDELRAKITYILAVERYQSLIDQFKITLGLPLGVEISLDDGALTELQNAGLIPLPVTEKEGYEIAVEGRLDLLNEIDRFEDSKRKIKVAASQLKAGLDFSASASLPSAPGTTDYSRFNLRDYQAGAGLELKLPLNRVNERTDYRASFITFERQLRTLSLSLDNVHNDVRLGLRTLQQARQNYSIQQAAAQLADRRVESATLLLQAGRAQIRDLLEAQNAQLTARNAVTAALVDYQNARLGLLLDLGRLDTGTERFWVRPIAVSRQPAAPPEPKPGEGDLIPPDKLFAQ